jgi:hypothetical protein
MSPIRLVTVLSTLSILAACSVTEHRRVGPVQNQIYAKDSFNSGQQATPQRVVEKQVQHHHYHSRAPYPYIQEELRPWGMAQSYTRVLRKSQAVRGAILADDPFYGVSAFSFVNCATVDLVGSDGVGLYSIAQPVCTMTTSTLSELDFYVR